MNNGWNNGKQVRNAIFASASHIYRSGNKGQKYEGRGVRTSNNLNNKHCAIVVPDFFEPHRESLLTKKADFRSILREEAALEPEHIDGIVVHGQLSDLRNLWSLRNIPDGIVWIVNANGVLDEAIKLVAEQRGSRLYVVLPTVAPQAIGLMISSWEEEGEIIIPSNRKMAQVHPTPDLRTSLRPMSAPIPSRR